MWIRQTATMKTPFKIPRNILDYFIPLKIQQSTYGNEDPLLGTFIQATNEEIMWVRGWKQHTISYLPLAIHYRSFLLLSVSLLRTASLWQCHTLATCLHFISVCSWATWWQAGHRRSLREQVYLPRSHPVLGPGELHGNIRRTQVVLGPQGYHPDSLSLTGLTWDPMTGVHRPLLVSAGLYAGPWECPCPASPCAAPSQSWAWCCGEVISLPEQHHGSSPASSLSLSPPIVGQCRGLSMAALLAPGLPCGTVLTGESLAVPEVPRGAVDMHCLWT